MELDIFSLLYVLLNSFFIFEIVLFVLLVKYLIIIKLFFGLKFLYLIFV